MKKIISKKINLLKVIVLLITIFSFQLSNAQGRINSDLPIPPATTNLNNNEGQWGPTIVIATTVGGVYNASKNKDFTITLNGTKEYRIVLVDGVGGSTNDSNYADLDDAVRACLENNYQHIIILEGEYTVNSTIVVDFLSTTVSQPSTTEVGNVGRITIEGEGFGTRIRNASDFNGAVFEVKSSYNTIKNMSILSEDNTTGSCIALSQGSANVSHNVFENLYLGDKAMGSGSLRSANGITINSSGGKIEHNRFKNIIFNRFVTGIQFSGSNSIFANHFEDLNFDNVTVGIEFALNTNTNNNYFENLTLQGDTYNTYFVKNVTGKNNYFNTISASDFPQTANFTLMDIGANAIHTTLENATEIGRAGSSNFAQANFYNYVLKDNGKYSQLINCFGSTSNLDVNYVFGNYLNPASPNAISTIELRGKLFISGQDNLNATTAAPNRFLKSDSNGYSVWSALAATTSTLWNYNANKNIRLNNYVISGGDNTTATGTWVTGLRVGTNGNVRIGNIPPLNDDGKLQVDGNFVSKQLNADGSVGEAQLTVKNGKVIIGKFSDDLLTNTNSAGYNLLVNGKARVREEVYVKGNEGTLIWPDYVFAKDYKLMPLQQVEQHIQQKGYLPNMPSAAEVEKDGIAMADMITRQQEKIEELTLYIIAMKKELEQIKANQK